MKTTIDLDRLAALALDLESGHPIEAVLRKHGIHERWSAYVIGFLAIQAIGNAAFILASAANPAQPILDIWGPQLGFNLAVVSAMTRQKQD